MRTTTPKSTNAPQHQTGEGVAGDPVVSPRSGEVDVVEMQPDDEETASEGAAA